VLKLWNTYAFFVNYAFLDDFDPAAPVVPVKDRPDIDRWILSDLQKLIRSAHHAFENYDLPSFTQQAEVFVDDKLSNWYVRRNRRRFWKSDQGPDKLAAYQTLLHDAHDVNPANCADCAVPRGDECTKTWKAHGQPVRGLEACICANTRR